MGYNLASAFLPEPPRPKFSPPFEGPVNGFKTSTQEAEKLMVPKPNNDIFKLRAKWIRLMFLMILEVGGNIPNHWVISWIDTNGQLPKTRLDLLMDIGNTPEMKKIARECVADFHAA